MSKYIKKDENGFYVFDEIEFLKTLPTGLEYFAVDKETEQIYNLGFNYKEKMEKQISDLEAKLAESEKKLNQYPYKNDVIEEQYEDLKDAITFLMLNNIKDQEQLNHSIDVLCEKHKARIRDIEQSICSIEQLKQQLAEKEEKIEELNNKLQWKSKWLKLTDNYVSQLKTDNQDKISFCIEKLEKVKNRTQEDFDYDDLMYWLNEQIKELKEGK